MATTITFKDDYKLVCESIDSHKIGLYSRYKIILLCSLILDYIEVMNLTF